MPSLSQDITGIPSAWRSHGGHPAGETGILADIGSKGVHVPRPFETELPKGFMVDVLLSNDEDSHHVAGCAFFMQPPRHWWAVHRGRLAEKDALKHVATTIDAVKHIRTVLNANPWADFQVLYNKAEGGPTAFGPWPDKAGIKQ
ncbi:hypothetical protein G647_08253 [Cladophialophora carrionii CBS 160.54]|uniref:Uncharacterized protein n=1 Tax=Cladophialophora carrionii CBS 160.54 TaxID=1279043 RepID=V9CZY5_9EURO|nr:uncharacterized protein G647_08253 [Cladophialophora carrionii CBS 160.54]ETI20219.1 hypothetical protein G647_08253 [Cladophialophora carrionii CBS 160.54]